MYMRGIRREREGERESEGGDYVCIGLSSFRNLVMGGRKQVYRSSRGQIVGVVNGCG